MAKNKNKPVAVATATPVATPTAAPTQGAQVQGATPVAATLPTATPTKLASSSHVLNVAPGSMVTTHGITVQAPGKALFAAGGSSLQTCKAFAPQWPDLASPARALILPSHGAPGVCVATQYTHPTQGYMATKLWPYAASNVAIALCPAGLAALQQLAAKPNAPASLLALAAACKAVG